MRNVVILGCGRSGSTILGQLFACHPAYALQNEPTLEQKHARSPVAVKTPKGSRPDRGLTVSISKLNDQLDRPLIIWNVRNPYDTVCSLRPGIGQGWSHNPRPPGWRRWTLRPVVDRCAYHWRWINSVGYRNVPDPITVRYEDVVADPYTQATRILAAANADDDTAARRWAATVTNTPGQHEAPYQTVWSRNDHDVRVGRWRRNLTADQAATVRRIVGDVPTMFGYAMETL